MGGARKWLIDNQQPVIRWTGSLAFVTAVGAVVATGARQHRIATILLITCIAVSLTFTTIRAFLVRSPSLGGLGVGIGVLAVVLQVLPIGSWLRLLPLLALASVTYIVLRRSAVEDSASDPPAPDEQHQPAASPELASAVRPRSGEPGFKYLPPPRS